jgi:flagellar export protein FliJ
MESRKLKRMLELKRRIEQAKKGELAIARHAREEAAEKLDEAKNEHQMRIDALCDPTELSVVELSERARFVTLAGQQVGAATKVVDHHDRELEKFEEERMLATRDVRTFEILTEKDREQRKIVQRRAEQSASDDVANARWSMNK